ncbi:hypothetical protein BJF93_11400 [Xaviernesmea oryzae]|uniref:HTH luxR-type domain-containing protein n=1 Tax=Xaviernesmea oryzae TaxID=464029 RepID=A0A1Q9AW13_9HYPH|nr:LuxR family transcriptional regulator [Xaviernesmea oryzae]OLP59666.1 hypothetical protein BJF93_11400 [Xaviernesmea oryzae]SEM23617.1 DNA-binding transcriptional regulator, CsgD family [Xaviernesmea oryzae]
MPDLEAAFYRIIDLFDNCALPNPSLSKILQEVCTLYGLKTAAYFGVNVSSHVREEICIVATYSPEWIEHYRHRKYLDIDPIIRDGFTSMLPIVWTAHDARTAKLKRFFGEALEFGVGTRGMTVPVRGRAGDRGLFTISSEQTAHDWAASRRGLERDMQMLAFHLHQRLLQNAGADRPFPALAPRQVECLKWRASGKTNWEISVILDISEKTVEGHLEMARVKLGASTTCHAVAKAINNSLFLISH